MIMLARPLVIMQVRRKIRFFKMFSMKFLYFFIPIFFSSLLIYITFSSFLPSFLSSFFLSFHPFFFFLSYILSSFFLSYFRSISLTSFKAVYINILMKSIFYNTSAYKSPERFSQLSTIFKFFILDVVLVLNSSFPIQFFSFYFDDSLFILILLFLF